MGQGHGSGTGPRGVSGRLKVSGLEYRVSPWDIAAGAVIIHEAGGKVSDCMGNPVALNRSSSLCASNQALHPAMLEIISKRMPRA